MRILHVVPMPFPAPLGSQVYAGRLAEAQAALGHDVTVACYAGGVGEAPAGVSVVRAAARWSGPVRSGPHWSRPLQDVSLARAIRRMGPVDIVHTHNVEGPVVARLAGVSAPVVYGQHTSMQEELPQWFAGPGWRQLGWVIDTVVPRLADRSVALSAAGRATLPVHSVVCPPGVRVADLDGADAERGRARWNLGSRPLIVYAGNTDPYQDVDVWLRAMRHVEDADVLLITGDAAAPWRAMGDTLGLGSRLTVVGGADFAQMKDALALAAFAVCPRRQCRGFPIKLLNQLGMGVPTVCAPGSARAIDGVVRARDDSERAFADAIRDLLRDPERRERLSRLARQDIGARWTWRVRAAEMVALYRRMQPR